jgi:hypothetical protein
MKFTLIIANYIFNNECYCEITNIHELNRIVHKKNENKSFVLDSIHK